MLFGNIIIYRKFAIIIIKLEQSSFKIDGRAPFKLPYLTIKD